MYRYIFLFLFSILSSSHLLPFSLLFSFPFSICFLSHFSVVISKSFPFPSQFFPYLHFSPFPFFLTLPFPFVFLVPSLHFLVSLSPSFSAPLSCPPLPLRLFSPSIFSSTVMHGNTLSSANFGHPRSALVK